MIEHDLAPISYNLRYNDNNSLITIKSRIRVAETSAGVPECRSDVTAQNVAINLVRVSYSAAWQGGFSPSLVVIIE